MINAYYKGKKIDKCYEIWDQIEKNPKLIDGKPDVNLYSLMVEICAAVIFASNFSFF